MASGAEITAPVLHQDPRDGVAADGTGFTPSMSNLEITLGSAQLALRANVGVHAGAFAVDGRSKNSADAIM